MARLSVELLGPPQVLLDGATLPALAWDKVLALLSFLAVEADRPHSRQELAGLLWPDQPESLARRNLSQALFELRRDLGDQATAEPFLLAGREAIQLNPQADARCDVAEFWRLLGQAGGHGHGGGACQACADWLAEAVALYRGDFLQAFALAGSALFEEWAVRTREALHVAALDALARLTIFYEGAAAEQGAGPGAESGRDLRRAEEYARRQLALEPWLETAQRSLMRILARRGQRSAALAQFEACRRVLRDELGVEPEAETVRLGEEIRAGKWSHEEPAEAVSASTPPLARAQPPTWLTPFIGRQRERAELAQLLTSGEARLVTLVGPGGAGKTRLAAEVAAELEGRFADGMVFVPLAAVSEAGQLAPTIGSALGVGFEGAADPVARLVAFLQRRRVLLVLDNLEQLLTPAGIPAFLSAVLGQAPGVQVLATSRAALGLAGEWLYDVGGLPVALPEAGGAPSAALPPKEGDPPEEGDRGRSPSAALRGPHAEGPAGRGRSVEGDAIALFVGSAQRAAGPGFALAAGGAAEVAQICRLVDGLPLAIELAAAWVRLLTLPEIAAEITASLDFLAAPAQPMAGRDGGAQLTGERHRSLRAVFEQSWRLLAADEQQALAGLTIFRGGFTRQAAAEVAGASLALLSGLAARSLVRRSEAGRYDLHELVRQYAAEHLTEDEAEAAGRRHCAYFLAFAEAAAAGLRGPERSAWQERVEAEHDNLRRGLDWSAARPGSRADTAAGLRLAAAAWTIWFSHWQQPTEGEVWLNRMLALPLAAEPGEARARALYAAAHAAASAAGNPGRAQALAEESVALYRALAIEDTRLAQALAGLGYARRRQGEVGASQNAWEESLALFRQADDRWGEADVTTALGEDAMQTGDYPRARKLLEEAIALWQELGDPNELLWALQERALVALHEGDRPRARGLYEESLAVYRGIPGAVYRTSMLTILARLAYHLDEPAQAKALLEEQLAAVGSGDRLIVAWDTNQIGDYERQMGNDAQAEARYDAALAIFRGLRHDQGAASVLHNLGHLRLHAGDDVGAESDFADALQKFRAIDHRWSMADCLIGLAGVAALRGKTAQAAVLLAAADAVHQSIDFSGSLAEPANRREWARIRGRVRAELDEAAFNAAWQRGEQLTLDEAADLALAGAD